MASSSRSVRTNCPSAGKKAEVKFRPCIGIGIQMKISLSWRQQKINLSAWGNVRALRHFIIQIVSNLITFKLPTAATMISEARQSLSDSLSHTHTHTRKDLFGKVLVATNRIYTHLTQHDAEVAFHGFSPRPREGKTIARKRAKRACVQAA